jgi:hypothetical protein
LANFWENFLLHLFAVWQQLPDSPYIGPTVLTGFLKIQGSIRKTDDWPNFLRSLLGAFALFCGASLLVAVGGAMGARAALPKYLAFYPLYFHFRLSTDEIRSIIAQNNFYDDCFNAFDCFFTLVLVGNRFETPFRFIANLGLALLIPVVCGNLAYGIQHLVVEINGSELRPEVVPSISGFSLLWSYTLFILLLISISPLSTGFKRLIRNSNFAIIEAVVRIIITVVILGFALSGFLFLPPYNATLWLLFWIIAYPVALSFTAAEPLRGASLVQIYVAGLKQVPVVGQIFGASLGKPPVNSPSTDQDQSGVSDKPSDKT